ncbi:MAG: adenosylmethionine decarboxylase [Pyrinomonadaceae bacterium]
MIVGTEWIVDAFDCDAEFLRDLEKLQSVFTQIITDLKLKAVSENWHQFEGEKGVTGLVLLTESHLACHTYPEHRTATFNLYCCQNRPEWNWKENLEKLLDAKEVKVTKIERGNPKSKIQNLKSEIAGGER